MVWEGIRCEQLYDYDDICDTYIATKAAKDPNAANALDKICRKNICLKAAFAILSTKDKSNCCFDSKIFSQFLSMAFRAFAAFRAFGDIQAILAISEERHQEEIDI